MLSQRMIDLEAYVPGEQPQDQKYIKLNTNENPFGPCPEVEEVLKNFNTEELRLYPDPSSRELRQKIADLENLSPEQVFPGNGSDEVLSFCFYAFFDNRKGPILFPNPSYSFYSVYSNYYKIAFQEIPLTDQWQIELADYLKLSSSGVIFPNPNAPTGCALSLGVITSFLESYDSNNAVIIDEAYIDFGCETASTLINRFPNLIVIRTMSKGFSLAGVRLGYALGSEEVISALFTVKDSFNSYPINRLTQKIALAALGDQDYYSRVNQIIVSEREKLSRLLSHMGWKVLPSQANFIFTRHNEIPGKEVYEKLKSRGILVRWFNKPRINDFLRVTLGKPEENQKLISVIKELFS